MSAADIQFPEETTRKWQGITDLLAEILQVPAALIMKVESPEIVVFISSESKGNPYERGERACLDTGLYCETVMKTRERLLVPDALADEAWQSNPDIKLGMVSYLGFPITWPTGDIFGTICVLHHRASSYSDAYQKLMLQCRDVIEADLTALHVVRARLAEEARAKGQLERQVAARTADLVQVKSQIRKEIEGRTRAEEAMRVSRELLQAVIDSSTAVIYVKDVEGRYMFINRRHEALFGVDRGTIVGKTDYDVFPRDLADAFRAFDQRALLAGTTVEDEEAVPHDGEVHTYISLKFPLRDAAGVAYAVCGISTDITERKRLEEQRGLLLQQEQRARAVAEAALRMRDDFLSIASHELYTPIAGLKLAVQGIVQDMTCGAARLPPRVQRLLALAEQQCQRVVKLIEALLDVTRIQAGNLALDLEELDLRTLTREVVGRFEAELNQAGSRVSWRAEAPVVGTWDRARIEQVVTNLVLNAIKYGAANPIEVRLTAEDDRARLVVADHGIGIAPSRLPHIFERFERGVSARHYGGLGLGLYITRQIVVAHGGSIEVESEVGAGTTFVVELPLGRPPQAEASAVRRSQ